MKVQQQRGPIRARAASPRPRLVNFSPGGARRGPRLRDEHAWASSPGGPPPDDTSSPARSERRLCASSAARGFFLAWVGVELLSAMALPVMTGTAVDAEAATVRVGLKKPDPGGLDEQLMPASRSKVARRSHTIAEDFVGDVGVDVEGGVHAGHYLSSSPSMVLHVEGLSPFAPEAFARRGPRSGGLRHRSTSPAACGRCSQGCRTTSRCPRRCARVAGPFNPLAGSPAPPRWRGLQIVKGPRATACLSRRPPESHRASRSHRIRPLVRRGGPPPCDWLRRAPLHLVAPARRSPTRPAVTQELHTLTSAPVELVTTVTARGSPPLWLCTAWQDAPRLRVHGRSQREPLCFVNARIRPGVVSEKNSERSASRSQNWREDRPRRCWQRLFCQRSDAPPSSPGV